jgi:hypothetical protein
MMYMKLAKTGRPLVGTKPMTNTDRSRKYRKRLKALSETP